MNSDGSLKWPLWTADYPEEARGRLKPDQVYPLRFTSMLLEPNIVVLRPANNESKAMAR
jgi:hypothetical protein